jgi:hypothetical protein
LHGVEFNVPTATAQTILPQTKPIPKAILAKRGGLVQVTAAIVNLLDSKFLFASLIWGSVGAGYFIYGKKQQATIPMIAGVVMVAISYLVGSWFWMSLFCLALMTAVYWLVKQGY